MEENINSSPHIRYKTKDTFGLYWLLEELGRGERSITFKAKHEQKDAIFAIKIYWECSETTQKLYDDEVQTYQQLHNVPGVLELRDHGLFDDCYFLVTDYMGAGTLRRLMQEKSNGFELPELLLLFTQIANTLNEIHRRGIVHRDIKPENILLNKMQHDYYQTFIVDFACARKTNVTGAYKVTDFSGTPDYYAPEEWSTVPKTKAVDIYAFGIMLYEAFERKHPFPMAALTPQDVAARLIPYPKRIKEITNSDEVVDLIFETLHKDPERRSKSAKAVIDNMCRALKLPYYEFRHFIGHVYNDRYVVVDIVGMGMASISLLACDRASTKLVVLKVFNNIDIVSKVNSEEAFQKEMKNLERVRPENGDSYPGILLPIDSFTEKGSFFIVTEYQSGGNLRDLLNSRPNKQLALPEVIEIFTPIAKAIEYVHNQQVVHRDLKPENIVYHESAGKKIIFLTDFGISGILEGAKSVLSTKNMWGTLPYLAPELRSEDPKVTKSVDIFAFGTMIYEALMGSLSDSYDDLEKIPPQLEGQAAGELLRKARSRNPEERPESAMNIIEELKQVRPTTPVNQHYNPHTPPTGVPQNQGPSFPPKPWRKYLAVAIGLLLFGFFWALLRSANTGNNPLALPLGSTATSTATASSTVTYTYTSTFTPTFTLTATRTHLPVPSPTLTPYVIASYGNIYCRQEPAQSAAIVHTILPKDEITIIGRAEGWLLVTIPGVEQPCWIGNVPALQLNALDLARVPTVSVQAIPPAVGAQATPTHGPGVPTKTPTAKTPIVTTKPPTTPPSITPSSNKECSDGIDNDNDGKTDYPADPQCRNRGDDSESQ